jgi:mRNA interferase YafQ
MFTLRATSQYRKDRKLAKKRGLDMDLLDDVIQQLIEGKALDQKFDDHALVGNYEGFRECHIQNDWLLIYAKDNNQLILAVMRTGSHSDLF